MSTSRTSELVALVEAQRAELRRLRRRIDRLEGVVAAARRATPWDFSVYEQRPDAAWVAVDRGAVDELLMSLEDVDDYRPWNVTLERRAS